MHEFEWFDAEKALARPILDHRRVVSAGRGMRPAFAASKPASHFGNISVSHIQSAAPAGIECRPSEQLHEARDWLETWRPGRLTRLRSEPDRTFSG
jgi:hypothetical protein